jgi:phage/plasmid-like protein (TIGR03299 family)
MHEFESGFAVREPSWHGLEKLVAEEDRPMNWEDARKVAGLTWDWQEEPLYQRMISVVDGAPVTTYREVPNQRIVSRTDTGEVVHTQRETRTIITIKDMGEIAHAITDQTRLPIETMGSVREGRSIYGLAVLGEDRNIGSDPSATRPYLGVVCHADGKGGARAYPTSIRIVCWNTLSAADARADQENTVATFAHRGDWKDRIEEARQAIFGARRAFDKWTRIGEELQKVLVTDTQAETFVRTLIPTPANTEFVSERVMRNIEGERSKVRGALASRTSEGIEGSAYWLVQGAAEYFDHLRKFKNQETYVARTLVDVNVAKGLATKFALEIAGAEDLFGKITADLVGA